MVTSISTKAFCLLNQIMSSPIPAITAQNFIEHFYLEGKELLELGALVPAVHCKYVESISDHEGRVVEIIRHDREFKYFSYTSGWVSVSPQEITLYRVNTRWVVKLVKDSIGISCTTSKQLDENIWVLGEAWLKHIKVPVIMANRLRQKAVYETLSNYLLERHSKRPALVLTLDLNLPSYITLPIQSRFVTIQDAMVFSHEKFSLDISFLAEKMGNNIAQRGFSNGYRNLNLNDKAYRFSNQQASILEILDKSSCPMHKHEITALSNSMQNDLKGIFRKQGKYHPAWGEVIRYDGKGNYWLEY